MGRHQPKTRTVKASDARHEFGKLLDTVVSGDERVLVQKRGVPVAAIISAEDLERFTNLEAERAARFAVIDEIHARNQHVDPDEVDRDVAAEIAAMRVERRAR